MAEANLGEKKVSERSTKGELWMAYNEALNKTTGQNRLDLGGEKKESARIGKTIVDLKSKFEDELSSVSEDLTRKLSDFADFADNLEEKRKKLIKESDAQKELLEIEIEKVRNIWKEEESEQKKIRQREEEEYGYALASSRRKEEDDYLAKKAIEVTKIAEEKTKIDERKTEIAKMEKDLIALPETIKNAVSEAVTAKTKELTSAHLAEIKELKLINDHRQQISALKIEEVVKKVVEQAKIIEKFEKELSIANREVKQIAVSVIENRGSGSTPQELEM